MAAVSDITLPEAAAMTGADRVIGVVIPGFGHPQFLNETLQDILNQTTAHRLVIVIVDDGCPYSETAAVPRHAMAALNVPLYYVRQVNKKLPAARNAGIRFLLGAHPEIEAFFFLDADNRLAPYALESYERALFQADDTGWAYPDIAFFGLAHHPLGFEVRETAPDYSVLKHLMGNISEAGSLVKADLFRQGLAFDEDMKNGFEDWDFWLTAVEAGWRGKRAVNSGFFYRRRPESMLSDSRRGEETLITRLRNKHPSVFSLTSVTQLVHNEAPRFVLIDERAGRVYLTDDPLQKGQELTLTQFRDYCAKVRDHDREFFAPSMVIAAASIFWFEEAVTPHFRYSLWTLLEAVPDTGPRVVHLKDGGQHVLQVRTSKSGVGARNLVVAPFNDFLALLADQDMVGVQWLQLHMLCPGFDWSRSVSQGAGAVSQGSWVDRLMESLKLAKAKSVPLRYMDRRYAGPNAKKLTEVLLDELTDRPGRAFYPFLNTDRIVGLVVLDHRVFSHAEQASAAATFIGWLKSKGITVRLGYEIGFNQDLPNGALAPFERDIVDAVPLVRQELVSEHRTYLGRRLKQDFSLRDKEQAVLLAQGADAVIGLGSVAVQSLFGEFKSFGVKSFIFADPPFVDEASVETDEFGRLLAYEHAEAGIVLRNDMIRAALAAEGVPPGKLMDLQRLLEQLQYHGGRRQEARRTMAKLSQP